MNYTCGMDEAAATAEAKGFEIVRPDSNRLLLDFDSPEGLRQYIRLREILDREFGITSEESWPSKTPGHSHMIVTLRIDLDSRMRVALQAALGSDGKRELLAAVRLLTGVAEPSMLFKPLVREMKEVSNG